MPLRRRSISVRRLTSVMAFDSRRSRLANTSGQEISTGSAGCIAARSSAGCSPDRGSNDAGFIVDMSFVLGMLPGGGDRIDVGRGQPGFLFSAPADSSREYCSARGPISASCSENAGICLGLQRVRVRVIGWLILRVFIRRPETGCEDVEQDGWSVEFTILGDLGSTQARATIITKSLSDKLPSSLSFIEAARPKKSERKAHAS
jgi:hypothetical protein